MKWFPNGRMWRVVWEFFQGGVYALGLYALLLLYLLVADQIRRRRRRK